MKRLFFFQKEKNKGLSFLKKTEKFSEIAFFSFIILINFFILFLIIRLFQLTIVKGNYYKRLSESNRIKEFLIEPKRGRIIDRKGFIIAKNLEPDLNQNIEEIKKNQQRIISKRVYEEPQAVSSVVGYQQIADKKDLASDSCFYKIILGDKIGKKGVEKIFECDLRGEHGKKLVEVDAQGNFLREIGIVKPKNGKDIRLALDLDLQKKAYDLIKDKKGAIIASKPQTGEILVLVSSPTFDPMDFENNNQPEKYFADKNKPLFNRATEGVYPPGSLFKLIVAIAALEEKTIDEKYQIEDKGQIKAGPLTFGNWYFLQYGKTDGLVDVVKAIKRSNDIFFYLVGEKLGEEKIKKWAKIFNLGKKTGFDLDEEEGLVPSSFWKEKTLGERWYLGDTYNLSIGQGYLQVTPLQINMVTNAIANNGVYCQPELLKGKSNCYKLPISQKTLSLIKEGMKQACQPGGTGWPLFNFKIRNSKSKIEEIPIGCKTGTAESHTLSGIPHAWITVFAPYDNPEIVLTVLVEEGGQGSDVAGPIAKELLKAYFEN